MGQRVVDLRILDGDDLSHPTLVIGERVGVQEAHRDRLDAAVDQLLDSRAHLVGIERGDHLAVGIHAF